MYLPWSFTRHDSKSFSSLLPWFSKKYWGSQTLPCGQVPGVRHQAHGWCSKFDLGSKDVRHSSLFLIWKHGFPAILGLQSTAIDCYFLSRKLNTIMSLLFASQILKSSKGPSSVNWFSKDIFAVTNINIWNVFTLVIF